MPARFSYYNDVCPVPSLYWGLLNALHFRLFSLLTAMPTYSKDVFSESGLWCLLSAVTPLMLARCLDSKRA